MDFAASRAGSRRLAALGLAGAALLAAAFAPAANAAPALSNGQAVSGPASAGAFSQEAMSIEFTRGTAEVAGPGALVTVRCSGAGSPSCVGTLSIEAPGEPPEVAYSVDRGEERVVVVPLGEQRCIFDGIVSVKTRVVAHTMQPTGDSLRSARTLRFK
jgi:hypothetical protein